MSLTAQQVIDGAAFIVGARAAGESTPSYLVPEGLISLNDMVRSWWNDNLLSPFVGREVFPLVANQNTYTMGPGGTFNTTRPMGLTGAALLLNPTISTDAITAVSTTNNTFTVATNRTSTYTSGTEFIITGSTGNNGSYTVVTSAFSVSTVITVVEPVSSSTADGTITVLFQTNSTTEVPTPVITDDQYQNILIKSLPNSQFTTVYYNQTTTNDLATIFLWPTPNTAANGIVLYRLEHIAEFASLSKTYSFQPGLEKALKWNLAFDVCTSWGRALRQDIVDTARSTLAAIKRQNTRWNDSPNEAAWAIRGNPRFGYNINTDSGG